MNISLIVPFKSLLVTEDFNNTLIDKRELIQAGEKNVNCSMENPKGHKCNRSIIRIHRQTSKSWISGYTLAKQNIYIYIYIRQHFYVLVLIYVTCICFHGNNTSTTISSSVPKRSMVIIQSTRKCRIYRDGGLMIKCSQAIFIYILGEVIKTMMLAIRFIKFRITAEVPTQIRTFVFVLSLSSNKL